MNQRRIVQQIPLTLRQRWCLCLSALPGWCVWFYIRASCMLVLVMLGIGLTGMGLRAQTVVGLLLNLCPLLLALTMDLSRTMQVAARQALRDLYHGFACTTADRVVCVSEQGIEFAVAGLLHPQPYAALPYHGHTYVVCYSPNTGVLWSIRPA